jgi:excisionase family DNA binding protein
MEVVMERLLTVPEVAELLGVTDETIRRWLRDGRLEGVLLSRRAGWRVRSEAVDRMLKGFALVGKLAA